MTDLTERMRNLELEVPNLVKSGKLVAVQGDILLPKQDQDYIKEMFPKTYGKPIINFKTANKTLQAPKNRETPLRVACILSGGPAPSGHNVIVGLYERLKQAHPDSILIGFRGGPIGVINSWDSETSELLGPSKTTYTQLDDAIIREYRNQGGFEMIGTGRDKIDSLSKLEMAANVMRALNLDGLVIIGGDDSNTNSVVLADYFEQIGLETRVIGVPKTIDGDLKNEYVETSFGFHSACLTYSQLIGNIMKDAKSSQKYYYFIRLMGRSASNITLECALQTHPNMAILGEEVRENGLSLAQIIDKITWLIIKRARRGKYYGVLLLAEGLIEFVPQTVHLMELYKEMFKSDKKRKWTVEDFTGYIKSKGESETEIFEIWNELSYEMKLKMISERDQHGNVNVSAIKTGKMLLDFVKTRLNQLAEEDSEIAEIADRFYCMTHFMGYEGRCGFPSMFDNTYSYWLGHTASLLIESKETGMMAFVRGITKPVSDWELAGIPITAILNKEVRFSDSKNDFVEVPVIKKYLVDLEAKPFLTYKRLRKEWKYSDEYRNPGPMQFNIGSSNTRPALTNQIEEGTLEM